MKLTIILAVLASAVPALAACSKYGSVALTFYGYPDNDPPGPATAYNCGGRNFKAGGTGTFADPLSMATAEGEFSQCEIVYLPYLKKYVRYEDYCQQCTEDWASGIRHIDIWTGSATVNGGDEQIQCENSFTPDNSITVVRSPASTYEVDITALYAKGTSPACRTSHMFPSANAATYCP